MSAEEGEIETKPSPSQSNPETIQQEEAPLSKESMDDDDNDNVDTSNPNSRKRNLQENQGEESPEQTTGEKEEGGEDDSSRQRFRPRPRVAGERLIKFLLTGHEAGVLIGRGGASVNELQARTGARVKVSNSTITFPGTNYRIILVESSVEAMAEVVKVMVENNVREFNKRELRPEGTDSEVQFLVSLPSAAAPVVIGKRGATVGELNKETGCNIRLGRQEDEVPGVRERITKFTGKAQQVIQGVLATIELIYKDEGGRASVYENKSTMYDVRGGDFHDSSRGGRDYRSSHEYPQQQRGGDYPIQPQQQQRFPPIEGRRSLRPSSPLGEDFRMIPREEFGSSREDWRSNQFRSSTSSSRDEYPRFSQPPLPSAGSSSVHAYSSSSNRYEDDRRSSRLPPPPRGPPPPPHQHNGMPSSSFDHPLRREGRDHERRGGEEFKLQVSVPDNFVGQMLGRGGENISVIQRETHTRISVSSRNEFVPGTRDRIVTIVGTPADCRQAEVMLGEKLPKV